MKVEYDPDADAAYVKLSEAKIVESEEIKPGIILDYDEKDEVVGIEILSVSKRSPGVELSHLGIETVKRS